METDFDFLILRYVPQVFRDFIWDEFYQTKGRGFSLEYHAPWLDENIICIVAYAKASGGISGGLIIKPKEVSLDRSVGLIGYVCVHPDFRGIGLSKSLIRHAIAYGGSELYSALILWTQKPEVYTGSGFCISDIDIFNKYASLPWDEKPKIRNGSSKVEYKSPGRVSRLLC